MLQVLNSEHRLWRDRMWYLMGLTSRACSEQYSIKNALIMLSDSALGRRCGAHGRQWTMVKGLTVSVDNTSSYTMAMVSEETETLD